MSLISAVLRPSVAGLYQIAILLPVSVPAGTAAVQAPVGAVTSPSRVSIFYSGAMRLSAAPYRDLALPFPRK